MSSKISFKSKFFLSLKNWSSLFVPLAMLSTVPVMTSFVNNRYQVSVQDLVLPIILSLITAAFVTAVLFPFWIKNKLATYLSATLVILTLTGDYQERLSAIYPLIKAFIPITGLEDFEPLVFGLIFSFLIFILFYFIGRKATNFFTQMRWNHRDISIFITITITFTFLFQFFPLAKNLYSEWPQFFYHPQKLENPTTKFANKPDIFYIVLDRYANQDVLENQFNFDNRDFIQFLENHNYFTNPSSYTAYPYTTMSIASTLKADYLTDLIQKFGNSSAQTIFPYHLTIRNAPVIETLKSFGYKYTLIGNWYESSNLSKLADNTYQQTGQLTIANRTFTLDSFPKNELGKSLYSSLVRLNMKIGNFSVLNFQDPARIDLTAYQLKTLRNLAKKPAGGRFIFAHLLIPHDPYFYNSDGSFNSNPGNDNVGKPIKEKYIQNLEYINIQMKEILSEIDKTSKGSAVVILQADEGPYPLQLNHENFNWNETEGELAKQSMLAWSEADLKMKFSNLAAYHIPGANISDLKNYGDPVNIFRLVFNTYFNYNFKNLPKCYYAYPNGRNQPFVFTDITKRLTGQTDSKCSDPTHPGV